MLTWLCITTDTAAVSAVPMETQACALIKTKKQKAYFVAAGCSLSLPRTDHDVTEYVMESRAVSSRCGDVGKCAGYFKTQTHTRTHRNTCRHTGRDKHTWRTVKLIFHHLKFHWIVIIQLSFNFFLLKTV